MRENNERRSINITPNLGTVERVLSVVSGSYLLYDALAKRNKSFLEAVSAGYLLFRGSTGFCPMYEAIVPGRVGGKRNVIEVRTSQTINRPRNEVYSFWRRLENLPLFMNHLERVVSKDENNSEWEAKLPGGVGTVTWEAVVIEDQKNRRISWKSIPGSTIENEGSVTFRNANGSDTTVVDVNIMYKTPLGATGNEVAKLLTPLFRRMVKNDIRNLKKYLESGEVPAVETYSTTQ